MGIETAQTELNAAWAAASEEMYKDTEGAGAQGAQSGAEGQATSNDAGDAVTDVDFEEVK